MTLRAFDNFRSDDSRDFDISWVERRSGVDRARVGEMAIGGGDDGSVEVGECRNEPPWSWDMVCVEAVEEETVDVVDDTDARASQVIGEWRTSGDAGFRRSASKMSTTGFNTTLIYHSVDSRGPGKIDNVNQLNTFFILALSASPK